MKEFLTNNWQGIAGIIGVIVAWFSGKKDLLNNQAKQSAANVTGSNIENVTATLDVYKGALDDLEERFKKRIHELTEDLETLNIQNTELRKVISDNEKYIKRLITKLEKYEKLEEED